MSTFLLMQADAAGAAAQLCVWGSSRKSVHDLQLHSSWGEEVLWSWGSHWLVAGSGWAWTLLPSPCIVSGRVLNWMCASVGTTRICHTVLPILCECDIRLLFLMPCSCVRYYQHNLCLYLLSQVMCCHSITLEDFNWRDIIDTKVQIQLKEVAHKKKTHNSNCNIFKNLIYCCTCVIIHG